MGAHIWATVGILKFIGTVVIYILVFRYLWNHAEKCEDADYPCEDKHHVEYGQSLWLLHTVLMFEVIAIFLIINHYMRGYIFVHHDDYALPHGSPHRDCCMIATILILFTGTAVGVGWGTHIYKHPTDQVYPYAFALGLFNHWLSCGLALKLYILELGGRGGGQGEEDKLDKSAYMDVEDHDEEDQRQEQELSPENQYPSRSKGRIPSTRATSRHSCYGGLRREGR